MTQGIAGITRNSCPLCGELTRVPVQKMLFRRSNAFLCSACKGSIIVAESTAMLALVGGFLGLAVAIGAYFRFLVWLHRTGSYPPPNTSSASLLVLLPVVLGFGAFVAGAVVFARWTLKLVPAGLD